ncbi:MAG: bifunctional glutamate N-acetyltransferase/amino-acid acetyltransferase ArgJ [Betaproteobacteria bacterium]|nr:bifunctional glutamate N-acetyltransferase/amino-acid acetyltransferase ArgJ [Betaproteobacteria bacterium]
MAVNLRAPDAASLLAINGVELGTAHAGIRRAPRADLMLMRLAEGSVCAGVFTQNSFAAAPVQVCREILEAGGEVRALLVNAGNANCGTGAAGLAAARRSCRAVAKNLGVQANQVLPFSTGVILEPLPVERLEAALPACVSALDPSHWGEAAEAIMTTDTVAKAGSRVVDIDGTRVTITGIAKGVGMLAPNMATMLTFIATDARIGRAGLKSMVREVAEVSFNRVTVDGDTSTNDSFILTATGRANNAEIGAGSPQYLALREAIAGLAVQLAQSIARDGEGATKFITIEAGGARDEAEALRVARAIAHSPLVKTAFFASDPNLGRLLMAIGNAGVLAMDTSKVNLWLGDVCVIENGGRAAGYREEDGARVMRPEEIVVKVSLGRGTAATTVWTCDYSYDYVKINAEYRT